jgi:superoxide dismutase, Cu-Zn family
MHSSLLVSYRSAPVMIDCGLDQRSVSGRSVRVHVKADDLKSQPAGDSGARIACGVIEIAKNQ